jgi:hypothetical protein
MTYWLLWILIISGIAFIGGYFYATAHIYNSIKLLDIHCPSFKDDNKKKGKRKVPDKAAGDYSFRVELLRLFKSLPATQPERKQYLKQECKIDIEEYFRYFKEEYDIISGIPPIEKFRL